jgi:hypothetical protein
VPELTNVTDAANTGKAQRSIAQESRSCTRLDRDLPGVLGNSRFWKKHILIVPGPATGCGVQA